jgi:integrase
MAPAPKMLKTKTPGVYKRGNRYVVVYRDASGKQRKESTRTYDDARRLKSKREAEVSNGEFNPLQRITLHKYATEWVESYPGARSAGISERTRDEYRRDMTAYAFLYFPPTRLLASITTHDVQQFVAWLMDEAKQERALSSRSVRRILAPLSACYTTAKRHGVVGVNPVHGVGVPRRPNETEDDRVKVLTRAQLAAFLLAVPTSWRLFFDTLAATCARWSEAIAWQWHHFDAENGYL